MQKHKINQKELRVIAHSTPLEVAHGFKFVTQVVDGYEAACVQVYQ